MGTDVISSAGELSAFSPALVIYSVNKTSRETHHLGFQALEASKDCLYGVLALSPGYEERFSSLLILILKLSQPLRNVQIYITAVLNEINEKCRNKEKGLDSGYASSLSSICPICNLPLMSS